MTRAKTLIAAILVFAGCLSVGFWIAGHRALWNDEYYSQVSSIDNISFADQFRGRIPEGGNAPLFYSLQKLFLQLIHYHVPAQWLQGHWVSDANSQIVLRIGPIIFMSLSISLVFYYFCRRYSWGAGFISLFIYISSYMVWSYWAEARPYALIVFLTTLQSVIFLNRIDQSPGRDARSWWVMLAGTNILLSLTSILCLGEILAVSVLWWALVERDWKKYILVTLLPVMIVLFYYTHAPKYLFSFGLSPEQLIRDNIARQRFDVLFIFLISISVYFGGQKARMAKDMLGKEILKPLPYVILMILVLASSAVVLWCFALHAKPEGQGFAITSRYFIYLTPIGVIATTSLIVSLYGSLARHRLTQGLFMGLIGFLMVQYFLKIVPGAIHSIMRG
jgi:hypothetical protein